MKCCLKSSPHYAQHEVRQTVCCHPDRMDNAVCFESPNKTKRLFLKRTMLCCCVMFLRFGDVFTAPSQHTDSVSAGSIYCCSFEHVSNTFIICITHATQPKVCKIEKYKIMSRADGLTSTNTNRHTVYFWIPLFPCLTRIQFTDIFPVILLFQHLLLSAWHLLPLNWPHTGFWQGVDTR